MIVIRQLTVFAAVMHMASAAYPFHAARATTKNTRKARMASKLLAGATETENSQLGRGRQLEQAEPDLSIYEVKFQQCQFVKAYDDELAQEEESKTVLGVKRFVVFRLCPANNCASCAYDFGEYIVDMDTYLEAATESLLEDREGMCGLCEEVCYADDDATKNAGADYVDCDSCVDYCAYFENMDDNGKYMESYLMAECQQVYESDDGTEIYAGAICSNSGATIKIGAFSDQYCSQTKNSINIENYLENGLAFDDDILAKVVDVDSCVSCIAQEWEIPEQNDQNDQNDEEEEVEVNEMCQTLYEASAKCESKYGFDNWWKDYEDYANQYVQEDLVCDFISSLGNGNYDEDGEIILSGSSSSGGGLGATGGQKFALTVFVLSTVGLAVYGASLHSQLTKGGKADLSSQGGAMA